LQIRRGKRERGREGGRRRAANYPENVIKSIWGNEKSNQRDITSKPTTNLTSNVGPTIATKTNKTKQSAESA